MIAAEGAHRAEWSAWLDLVDLRGTRNRCHAITRLRQVAADLLIAVAVAQLAALVLTIWLMRSGLSGFFLPQVGALLVGCLAIRTSHAGLAKCLIATMLVWEATILVFLFKGHPWQTEMNVHYVATLGMLAILCDFAVLSYGLVLTIGILLGFDLFAPGLMDDSGLARVLLHVAILSLETLALAALCAIVRMALAYAERSEARAADALSEVEDARQRLSRDLVDTSERADQLGSALERFRSETCRRLDTLHEASVDLSQTAQDFSSAAERTTGQSIVAATASAESDAQVRAVALTYEELHGDFLEIGKLAARSRHVSDEAAASAASAGETIAQASDMSGRIDAFLGLIGEIAAQTNLLALNATIEAARAGEHGRGFAVVAGEVKQLSLQTTRAVAGIQEVIGLIKTASGRSTEAIGAVVSTIGDLAEVATQIAEAVGGKLDAAQTVRERVTLAASTIGAVTGAVGDIRHVAAETGQGSAFLRMAAAQIADQTAAIRRDVEAFTADLAA